MLYARAINLRTCGRFTVVVSDFGSDYRTHTHVTSEALYASLTRGATWRPRLIDLKDDPETFTVAYDVAAMPIWFLPCIFVADGNHLLAEAHLDTTAFNVVHEFYPSTSRSYIFKKGNLEEKMDRPYHVPTYGTIQAVKPNQQLITYAFSQTKILLEKYTIGQVFLLGKKRTMIQITDLSEIVIGKKEKGTYWTSYLQLPFDGAKYFSRFEILAVTMRYIIISGEIKSVSSFWRFPLKVFTYGHDLVLPNFYLSEIPLTCDH